MIRLLAMSRKDEFHSFYKCQLNVQDCPLIDEQVYKILKNINNNHCVGKAFVQGFRFCLISLNCVRNTEERNMNKQWKSYSSHSLGPCQFFWLVQNRMNYRKSKLTFWLKAVSSKSIRTPVEVLFLWSLERRSFSNVNQNILTV